MLRSVDVKAFAIAIKQSYKLMNDTSALNMASKLTETLDIIVEPAVHAWIAGQNIPDIEIGKYSVSKILGIRNSCDYLEAFRLLSEYKLEPEKGEKNIWSPRR